MNSQFNTPEENRLIRAASKGDREAFGAIVILYEKLVYNSVRAKLGNDSDAFDVSQEVFIKLWKSLSQYRGDCRFTTWLYKICQSTCLDFLRREVNNASICMPVYQDRDGDETEIELPDDSVDSSPEAVYERTERISAVRSAIAALSSDQREVVMLRDIEGYSYEEIADMLEVEIGTVKSRLNRARNNLKIMLERYYVE